MESWNVIKHTEDEYALLNRSRTTIRLSRRADVDLGWLMSVLEELNVPVAYTSELDEIYFTYPRNCAGDYENGKIRVRPHRDRAEMVRILIHEIGHHVDDLEDLSERESLVREKRDHAHHLDDKYASQNVAEYIACGFEIFYCGTTIQKNNLKKFNPRLFNVIRWIHRKYKNR